MKLDPCNPRFHSKKQIQQIALSIQPFGFIVPILIDAQGKLLAGHGRMLAAHSLGLTQIPTIMVDHFTEHQVCAFMIADNRLTENAAWDEQLLAEKLKILSEIDLNFSVEVTGFEMGEIDFMVEGLAPAHDAQEDPADAPPEVPENLRVSRGGDLWTLGRNRVVCGNALDGDIYGALLQGNRATMIFADPPYNVPIAGHVTGLGKIHHRGFQMASGKMTARQIKRFLSKVFALLASHSTDRSLYFICIDWRHLSELLAAGQHDCSELKNLCVWVKDNGGMGSLYRSQHELGIRLQEREGSASQQR